MGLQRVGHKRSTHACMTKKIKREREKPQGVDEPGHKPGCNEDGEDPSLL